MYLWTLYSCTVCWTIKNTKKMLSPCNQYFPLVNIILTCSNLNLWNLKQCYADCLIKVLVSLIFWMFSREICYLLIHIAVRQQIRFPTLWKIHEECHNKIIPFNCRNGELCFFNENRLQIATFKGKETNYEHFEKRRRVAMQILTG